MSKTEFRNVSTQKIIEKFNQVALHNKEELKKYNLTNFFFFINKYS